MSGPKIGELFAGYGGLGMGVQQVLGGDVVWLSEYDRGPSKILAHRFPGVPNHGDITRIDWSAVEPVDVLTGGSPCQDLSHAGKRAGMTEGTRSNLWVAMREAIAALRPNLVIWENVRGAYSAPASSDLEPCAGCVGDGSGVHLRALGRVLGDLAELGYDARWHGLRAADVGAPHGRFRVFLVAEPAADTSGLRRGARWAAVTGEASGGRASADLARRGDAPLTYLPTPQARDWKGYGPADGERHDPNLSAIPLLLPTPRATDGTKGGPNQRGSSGDLMLPAAVQPERLLPTPMVGSTSEASHGQISGQYRAQMTNALSRWGDYADAIRRWEHVIGRPAPEPTQTSAKGNPQLSPRFTEWMMGLPDAWITDVPGITRNEALKACGNGVVPQQAAAAIAVMLGADVIGGAA